MRKRSIGKKIFSLCFAAMIITSICGVASSAGNITDTAFTFNFSAGVSPDRYTEARAKRDDTSMYIKCTSASREFTVHAFGQTWDGRIYNCATGSLAYQRLWAGQTRYVTNSVNEDGHPYGGLVGSCDASPYSWTASGVWSPDSV